MYGKQFLAALCAMTACAHLALAADAFPNRPIKVIMPFAAGGGPDIQMRQLAPKLGEALGQPVVVENKVGAGGVLGAQVLKQSPPDGYTLMNHASSLLVQTAMNRDLNIDLVKDFAPITVIGSSPTVLMVRPNNPVKSLDELLRLLKANPGKMNYGSGGIGTAAHLACATLLNITGAQAVHIPLKGSVEIPLSLLRGDTAFACPIAGTAVPQAKSGALRPLAVTSASRLKELPDVPTMTELVHNDLTVQESWFGLWAPKGTPANVVDRLFAATRRAMADQGVITAFSEGGTTASVSASPAEFASYVQRENTKWTEIVKVTRVSGN